MWGFSKEAKILHSASALHEVSISGVSRIPFPNGALGILKVLHKGVGESSQVRLTPS